MNCIEDLYFLLREEANKLRSTTTSRKAGAHFNLDDLPTDNRVCKKLLFIMINNYWNQRQDEIIKKIRQRLPTVPFYRLFSSYESYHRFMCQCVQDDLIEEEYQYGSYLERVTIKPQKGKIMRFSRLMKEHLIDHPDNAIYGFDMTLMKRFIGMGCAIKCNNHQSLVTSLYRL